MDQGQKIRYALMVILALIIVNNLRDKGSSEEAEVAQAQQPAVEQVQEKKPAETPKESPLDRFRR